MEDKKTKEKISSVFRKIAFFKIIFMLFEGLLLYALFKNHLDLSITVLSIIVILLVTLFINLWEAINKERLNNDR